MKFDFASGQNRPDAYNHMEPYKRLNSFIKGMLYKIEADLKAFETELKMWNEPVVSEILKAVEDERQAEIDYVSTRRAELLAEQKRWEKIAEQLHYCTNCNGCGSYWECLSQDESISRTCSVCKGTGMNPSAAGELPPVPAPKKKTQGQMLAGVGRKFR